MAPLPPLPLDLLAPILSHIHAPESLRQLCLVSKSFLHEAQRPLYADIALTSGKVPAFCRTVTASSRVTGWVVRLSVQLSLLNDGAKINKDSLARALRLLPALRALEIIVSHTPRWARVAVATPEYFHTPWARRISAKILHGCPFKLKQFGSGLDMAQPDFIAFLGEQHEIEELVSYDIRGDTVRLPAGCLPKLRTFRGAVTRLEWKSDLPDTDVTTRLVRRELMDVQFPGYGALHSAKKCRLS